MQSQSNQQAVKEPQNAEPQQPTIQTDSEQQREFERIKNSSSKLNLVPEWLRSTTETINKVNNQLQTISNSQKHLQEQLQDLQVNRKNFQKLSEIKLEVNEYTQNHRHKNVKLIQIIHPMLMVQIYSFVSHDPYLQILKHRRVSSYFYSLCDHNYVVSHFSSNLLGHKYTLSREEKFQQLVKVLKETTKQYVFFINCFQYYKEQNYVKVLTKNSFLNDLIQSLRFVNKIFQLSLLQTVGYQIKVNKFLLQNHGIMALQSLALMQIPVLKMNAIQALINHISYNDSLKSKKSIPSKQLKMLLKNDQTKCPIYFNARITPILFKNGIDIALVKVSRKHQLPKQFSQKVKVKMIGLLSENILQFDGQIQPFSECLQVRGSNFFITVSNDRLSAHIDKEWLSGVFTYAFVNKELKQIMVYLNESNCMIMQY